MAEGIVLLKCFGSFSEDSALGLDVAVCRTCSRSAGWPFEEALDLKGDTGKENVFSCPS